MGSESERSRPIRTEGPMREEGWAMLCGAGRRGRRGTEERSDM